MNRASVMKVMFLTVILALWPISIRAEEPGTERTAAETAAPQRTTVDWFEWPLLALADSTTATVGETPQEKPRESSVKAI